MKLFKRFALIGAILIIFACSNADVSQDRPINEALPSATIFTAKTIITMDKNNPAAAAVAVRESMIVGVGSISELEQEFPDANIDTSFVDKTLLPGLIDPHVHMILGAMFYALPFAPPWEMATPKGWVDGLPDRASFLARIAEIERNTPGDTPLIIYGYHNLVHGDLNRHDLDAITTDRAFIIWHYSGHDFYLNGRALEWAKIEASLADKFAGVALDDDGAPTGRVYEDAVFHLLETIGELLLAPERIADGFNGFENMLAQSGVTAVAELGYGLFGRALEDTYYAAHYDEASAYRLYLVPEHRAFAHEFGDAAPTKILEMVEESTYKQLVVLPQVKLFTDAAFYSQTMRLLPPGYLAGQSEGTVGLWVTEPDDLSDVMRPYWEAGLDIRIHSNGDAAQVATLAAFAEVKEETPDRDQILALEHVGIMRPQEITEAARLGVGISAASHYVYYMGEDYRQAIGDLADFISPLASITKVGAPVALHSDAPLAPPSPLRAAAVHVMRSTRQGGVATPDEGLSPYEALESVTLDAAWMMGLDDEIGSIAVGKRADFTVLEENPLETAAKDWANIGVWGVVLGGEKSPVK